MAQVKKKKKSNIMGILITLLIIVGIGFFVANKESTKDTYSIKSSGGGFGGAYRESFINLTGDATEDKKIELSDDYWTGGKFK